MAVPSISICKEEAPNAKKKRVEKVRKTHNLHDLKKSIPTPSSFPQHNEDGWDKVIVKYRDKLIYHHDSLEQLTLPVCLLNPIFNDFVHDLDHIHISSED